MMITIKVVNCKDGDAVINNTAPRKLLRAIGLMPGGQLLIESRIMEGHDPATQSAAVKQITTWLHANRPTWDICIDGPVVQFDDDGTRGLAALVVTADTITDEQIRWVHEEWPCQFGAEACADALGLPPSPYDSQRSAEIMERERVFQRTAAAMLLNRYNGYRR